ncbi:MAG: hypothetical protein ACXWWC_10695 [Chitinophagaceae bacterium]
MSTIEFTKAYISRLCKNMGTTAEAIYSKKTGAWYFQSNSATIEVYLTNVETEQKTERIFIRCMAPIYKLPADTKKKLAIYESALEINSARVSFKLATLTDKNLLCVVTERDIEGMDYEEFYSLIFDNGFWADQLTDYFEKNFGK